MRNYSLTLAPLAALFLFSNAARADETDEQILAELKALRSQVAALETRVAQLENAAPPSSESSDAADSQQPRSEKKWFDHLNLELKKAEIRASGSWTDPAIWSRIEVGLSEEETIAILGEPTFRKFSVRKDTDEILHYTGDLEGTGEPISGEIRIYKGTIRRFTVPDFPSD